MKRTISLVSTALLAMTLGAAPSPQGATVTPDDHRIALAAIADIAAARAEIVQIEDSNVVGHPAFVHAAQRALNAVVGRGDPSYSAADGDPGDGVGAIGHVDQLLDRTNDSLWTPAMQGAKANLLAVVVDLHDAMHEKQMEDYQTDLTEAMANISLAVGRPSEDGVLGGISGALANTSLGVPAGIPSVSGCTMPATAPAYGVVRGHLAYIALPRNGATNIPVDLSVERVVVDKNAVVLYTHAADTVANLCRVHLSQMRDVHAAGVYAAHHTVRVVAAAAAAGASSSALSYTADQAKSGAAVYAQQCIGCHGANLQGVAAPAVAGNVFLKDAKNNKWTLDDLRTLVTQNMPLSNPGSLTPKQYADVMAYLLAANCFKAGSKPFPEKDSPSFASVKLGPVAGAAPTDPKFGTCTVK